MICYCDLPVLLFLILFGGLAVFVYLYLSVSYGGLKGEVDFSESEIRSFNITRRIAFGGAKRYPMGAKLMLTVLLSWRELFTW